MAKSYDLVYSEEAAELLLRVNKKRCRSLTYDLRRLAEAPTFKGDYTSKDQHGRDIEHLVVGDFVISYWFDHAVSELRVVDIADVS